MVNKQETFMQVYQPCHEPFVRYCSALAFGRMDTEDLIQDVLLSAYQHFEKIQKKGQFLHYLIRAARNRSISNWRRRKLQQDLLEKHTNQLMGKGLSPELSLDIGLMYKAMDKLPVKQSEAIMLFEISGFSIKEIAAMQNRSEGAVKTTISRGRKKLKDLLEDSATTHTPAHMLNTLQTILL